MDAEAIKQAVHAALNERDGLDRERHRNDHDWVYERRQREQLRAQRREMLHDKVKATVVGGLLLLVLSGAVTVLYNVGKFVIDAYQKSQGGH